MRKKSSKIFILLISFFVFSFTNVFAETKIYLKDSAGLITGSVKYDESNPASRLRLSSFCAYKLVFEGQTCVYEEPKMVVTGIAKLTDPTDGFVAQVLKKLPKNRDDAQQIIKEITKLGGNEDNQDSANKANNNNNSNDNSSSKQPQIVYQIIERAVPGLPGPQGPKGDKGDTGAPGTGGSIATPTFIPTGQYSGVGNETNQNISPSSVVTGAATTSTLFTQLLTVLTTVITSLTATDASISNATTSVLSTTNLNASGTSNITNIVNQNATITNANATNVTATNVTVSSSTIQNAVITNITNNYATISDATTTNLNSVNLVNQNSSTTNLLNQFATLTNASSSNFFSTLLNAVTQYVTNLIGTNATITNATSTNFASTNQFTTNLNTVNQISNNSTITNATATNLNATNVSITGGTVQNATFTQNFYVNATSTFTNNTTFATTTQASSTVNNLNSTNANITNITNNFATITSGSSTNFFANLLTALSAFFTNLTASNSTLTNATSTNFASTNQTTNNLNVTNATTVNQFVTNQVVTNTIGTNATLSNATATNLNVTNQNVSNQFVANATITAGTSTDFFASIFTALTAYLTNIISSNATITNATSTNQFVANQNVTNSNITNLSASNGTITNATATNLFVTNVNNTNATTVNQFVTNQVVTNTVGSNATLTNATVTNANITNQVVTNTVGSNATFTQATSTNLFANIFTALSSFFTNLVATNATLSNATATNLSATNISGGNANITSINVTNGTITNSTSTNLFSSRASLTFATTSYFYSNNSVTDQASSTYFYSQVLSALTAALTDLVTTRATFTQATSTNFQATTASLTNASFTKVAGGGLVSCNATNSKLVYDSTTQVFQCATDTAGALPAGYTLVGDPSGQSQATSSLFISQSGNVGIGTVSPNAKLDVAGLINSSNGGISVNGATGGFVIGDRQANGNYSQLYRDSNITRLWDNVGSDVLQFDSTGNFGVKNKLRVGDGGTFTPGFGDGGLSVLSNASGFGIDIQQNASNVGILRFVNNAYDTPRGQIYNDAIQVAISQNGSNIVSFTNATSTFSSTGGINLTNGCFAVGGTCIGASLPTGSNTVYEYNQNVFTSINGSITYTNNSLTSPATAYTQPTGIAYYGGYMFVGHAGEDVVRVYDVSTDPSSPTYVSQFNTGCSIGGLTVSPGGQALYVSDYVNNNIKVFNLSSSITNPPLQTTVSSGGSYPIGMKAHTNGYLYVANNANFSCIGIFNISSPLAPSFVSCPSVGVSPSGVEASGNNLYVTYYSANQVWTYDISTPTTLSYLGSDSTNSNPMYMMVLNNFLYVANRSSNNISTYTLSTPSDPAVSGSAFSSGGTGPISLTAGANGYFYGTNNGSNSFTVYKQTENPGSGYSVGKISQSNSSQNITTNQLDKVLYIKPSISSPALFAAPGSTNSVTRDALIVNGAVRARGFVVDTAADLAETFPTSETNIRAGMLVAFSNKTTRWNPFTGPTTPTDPDGYDINELKIATGSDDVVGVVSTNPGFLLGGSRGGVPVAFSGRVPVLVTQESGIIKRGDKLTLSFTESGKAMKLASDEGFMIGTAMSDDNGNGKVLMLVEKGFFKKDVRKRLLAARQAAIASSSLANSTNLGILQNQVTGAFDGAKRFFDEVTANIIRTKILCIGDSCVNEDQFKTILRTTNVTGSVLNPITAPNIQQTTPSTDWQNVNATSTNATTNTQDNPLINTSSSTNPTDTVQQNIPVDTSSQTTNQAPATTTSQ